MNVSKDHQNRLITGVVGLIVVVLIVGYGSKPIFFLFTVLIQILALKEFYALASHKRSSRIVGIVAGVALAGGFFILQKPIVIAAMAGIGLILCLSSLLSFQKSKTFHGDLESQVVGTFVIAFFLSHLIWLRDLEHGQLWVLFLLSVIFACDTCALYGGKRFGSHKLSPNISPGKTVEGTIAGLVGGCLGGVVFGMVLLPHVPKTTLILIAVLLGILGQMGDLWESALKRKAMVKDSGTLLPGHGGFLDRVDSILFTAPFLYYFIMFHEYSI
jgi:phosphatidate cytidylyltransferase